MDSESSQKPPFDIPGDSPDRQVAEIRRVTLGGLVVNLVLCVMKFVFGIVGASQALVADAVHSLSDSVTDVTVYFGARLWSAPPDAEHPHGHGRIETLITFFIGIALGIVGCALAYRAVVTLHEQQFASPRWSAFVAACLSIAGKEWLYRWNVRVGRRVKSSAVLANAWHHRSDALSSLPVALAVLGTQIVPHWKFLDHIATVIVAVLILYAAWEITVPAFRQLVDAGAAKKEREEILSIAMEVDGVHSVHALRTRYIGPGLQADLHVLVDPAITVRDGHDIAMTVTHRLREKGPDIIDALVHIEPFDG
jgi:cation diffusion facilitator family transporter